VRRARVVGVELGECFDEQWLAHVTRAEVLVTKLIEQVTRSETKSGNHTKAIDRTRRRNEGQPQAAAAI
jgi:hypothetical protein